MRLEKVMSKGQLSWQCQQLTKMNRVSDVAVLGEIGWGIATLHWHIIGSLNFGFSLRLWSLLRSLLALRRNRNFVGFCIWHFSLRLDESCHIHWYGVHLQRFQLNWQRFFVTWALAPHFKTESTETVLSSERFGIPENTRVFGVVHLQVTDTPSSEGIVAWRVIKKRSNWDRSALFWIPEDNLPSSWWQLSSRADEQANWALIRESWYCVNWIDEEGISLQQSYFIVTAHILYTSVYALGRNAPVFVKIRWKNFQYFLGLPV
jgi:hypothetical protein